MNEAELKLPFSTPENKKLKKNKKGGLHYYCIECQDLYFKEDTIYRN